MDTSNDLKQTWQNWDFRSAFLKSGGLSSDKKRSMPKVVLRPVPWSLGPNSQSTFVAELSTLISSILSTKQMTPRGSLQLRLATGWVLPGAEIGVFRTTITLNCQIEQLTDAKATLVSHIGDDFL